MAENPNDEPCPFCESEPSVVTGGDGYETTLVGYTGIDMNRRTYRLECSRGHRWRLVRQYGEPDEVTRLL